MKILFLDFDGVVNAGHSSDDYHALRRAAEAKDLDTVARIGLDRVMVARVDAICEATGAKVVVTSQWRESFDAGELEALLRLAGLRAQVAGCTPRLGPQKWSESSASVREREIKTWRSQNAVRRYVILDDLWLHCGWFVQTNEDVGLTDADVERAIQMLGSTG